MEKRKAVFFFPPSPRTAQIYKRMQRRLDGEDGQWRCGVMGHAAESPRCPDPVDESSQASRICELDMRLALLCLSSFLLGAPVDEVLRSPSSSFVTDKIERAGRHSWTECSFSAQVKHPVLVKPLSSPSHAFSLLSQAFFIPQPSVSLFPFL